jgi:hypothetical protein
VPSVTKLPLAMKSLKNLAISSLIVLCGSASAAVLASTNFDGRTLPSANVASSLTWTTNGLDDPGDMAAFNAAASSQAIFNGNALVQDMFVPGINTGNGNTFWTTSLNLTVASGSTVSLTDVTFDYWSINGGQNQNVVRGSDFTLTLKDPSDAVVGSVEVLDTLSPNGTGGIPVVTMTFPTPVDLIALGTYTLEIKGGDYSGDDETGNHTGIDNLSINGTVAAVPEPTAVILSALGLLSLAARRRR